MRKEFSRKVRAKAMLRSMGLCDGCGAKLKAGEGEYDHVLPAALGGEATVENCQVLCRICHRGPDGKTTQDIRRIRKADRQRDRHTGALAPKRPMQGRQFPRTKEPRAPKPQQPVRILYRERVE